MICQHCRKAEAVEITYQFEDYDIEETSDNVCEYCGMKYLLNRMKDMEQKKDTDKTKSLPPLANDINGQDWIIYTESNDQGPSPVPAGVGGDSWNDGKTWDWSKPYDYGIAFKVTPAAERREQKARPIFDDGEIKELYHRRSRGGFFF